MKHYDKQTIYQISKIFIPIGGVKDLENNKDIKNNDNKVSSIAY